MAETIYEIPIRDAFAGDGCPFCTLHSDAESKSLEYILGGAVMEPRVRAETSRLGFCGEHLEKLLNMKNRLALALALESRISEILNGNAPAQSSCFICERVSAFEKAYTENTVHMWKTDPEFARILRTRGDLCLHHAGAIISAGKSLRGSKRRSLENDILSGISPSLCDLLTDLRGFIKSFDHRFSGKPLSEAERTALERAAEILGRR